MPSFLICTAVLLCLIGAGTLLAVFRVSDDDSSADSVLIAIGSVVALALLLNCRTWWRVTDSVLNSQRKRLHGAANRMHKLKSEGFMKVRGEKGKCLQVQPEDLHVSHLIHGSVGSEERGGADGQDGQDHRQLHTTPDQTGCGH